MKTLRLIVVLALLHGGLPVSSSPAQSTTPDSQVLLIGNSYSGSYLAKRLQNLLSAAGRRVSVTLCSRGSYTLHRHAETSRTRDIILGRTWDVVVLQEQSTLPLLDSEEFELGVESILCLLANDGNEERRTILFMHWARKDIPEMLDGSDSLAVADQIFELHRRKGGDFEAWYLPRKASIQRGLAGVFASVSQKFGLELSPVGQAWKIAVTQDSQLPLYSDDGSHPLSAGSYLTACVLYGTITGRSPQGLPCSIKQLSLKQASQLQDAAWQAVQEARGSSEAIPSRR